MSTLLKTDDPRDETEQAASPCRACGAPLTHSFIDLGMSPLANSNIEPSQLSRMEPFYPLHAYVCDRCFLVQLEEFESPAAIFSDYAYLSSCSPSWVAHARDYVEMISERLRLGAESRVVEIASNDGYLLQFFVERGIPALGIEPAANVAEIARDKGVPTEVCFFGTETARRLAKDRGKADLIVGNNVLAHVPALNDFVAGLSILLGPNGVVTMEFPHLLRLIEGHQFDTIYHEHFSYLSLLAVSGVFARHGLTIFDVEELPTHGGSLRIYAGHSRERAGQVGRAVDKILAMEKARHLDSRAGYDSFAAGVRHTKASLLRFLLDAKDGGRKVVGYGAPAKGNTLLNYCGVRADLIDFVVDVNPLKQGRLLPGTRIPIMAPSAIEAAKPDYLLILPWNLRDEIMAQNAKARQWGCRFVTPIPEVRIFE